jgi:hypothetical protein
MGWDGTIEEVGGGKVGGGREKMERMEGTETIKTRGCDGM